MITIGLVQRATVHINTNIKANRKREFETNPRYKHAYGRRAHRYDRKQHCDQQQGVLPTAQAKQFEQPLQSGVAGRNSGVRKH